jgi:hypothetical protein
MATQSRVRWWGPKVTQPCCRACGYAVQGLPSFTCPECGSDLRVVGIDTPGMVPLFVRYLRAVCSVVRGEARALGQVLTLGGPVNSHPVVIETRYDGRVIFTPPLRLPDGRHKAVVVIRNVPE